jgi:hypothetical protein
LGNSESQLVRKYVAIYPKLSFETLKNWVYKNKLKIKVSEKQLIADATCKLKNL